MGFLYMLEKIRIPALNEFMLLVTKLGEETAFLVVALLVFWCVSKKMGYYLLSVGFIGTLANQFMKLWFRIPRPWLLDPNFKALDEAVPAATGYSFPSGHTQNAVGTFGSVARTTKKRWIRISTIVIAVLIAFSRMYVGVHTPSDVIVAAGMAVALIFLIKPIVYSKKKWCMPTLLAIMLVLAIAYLCFVTFYQFPEDIIAECLQSGKKNAYTLFGALLGLIIVYIVDEKWLNFSTEAVWWAQIMKVAGGALLVLAVKSGLKTPLNLLFGESIGRSIRYCLLVIIAGIVWPLTFRFFSKLGKKEH